MIKRQQRIEWIAAVAKEHLAARSAAKLLNAQLQANPNYGSGQGWDARDAVAFIDYLVRLYAEFEAGLRDYWANHLKKSKLPPMFQLLQFLAGPHYISMDQLEDVDAVREFRNFLVHDESDKPPPDMRTFSVAEAKKHLCYYFGRLDPDW